MALLSIVHTICRLRYGGPCQTKSFLIDCVAFTSFREKGRGGGALGPTGPSSLPSVPVKI